MLHSLGPMELVIVLVIVVMLAGASKLPQAAASLGKAVKEFRKASHPEAEAPDAEARVQSRTTMRRPPNEPWPATAIAMESAFSAGMAEPAVFSAGTEIGEAVMYAA